MACDIANSSPSPSPYPENFLDDTWGSKDPETTDLDTLAEFNAAFGGNGDGNAGIDPQMLSNPSSPTSAFTGTAFDTTPFDQSLNPETSAGLGAYPSMDFASPAPYYQQSMELHSAAPFQPSALRYQTRQRSVSEPPDGFAQHHPHQPRYVQSGGPPMMFHRGGHYLGRPQATTLKSLPKGKAGQQMRSQPYKCKPSRQTEQHQQQQRYQLRRAQTQPVRPPPTSVPAGMGMGISMPPNASPMPQPMMAGHMLPQQQAFDPLPPVMEGQAYVTSRVCTPAPEIPPPPAMMGSPAQPQHTPQIDPLLTQATPSLTSAGASVGGSAPAAGYGGTTAVTVPLTVDELRAMIFEAVQKAVKGLGGRTPESAGGEVEKQLKEEEVDVEGEVEAEPEMQ